jgi:6-phosphogluconate dehydrogenase
MNDHGYRVAVFNRTVSKVDDFINNEAKGTQVAGAHSIAELTDALKKPRRVMLMVKAGDTVDQMIDSIVPHLEKGDIIIDGGNSLYTDTNRRTKSLAEKGILFIGTGVSGGEEGARHGPSIMPGGNPAAWPHVKEIFQAIDGPQRHRVRRYAVDLRSVPVAPGRAGLERHGAARRIRGVEQG